MKTEQKLPGNTEPVETKDRITDAAVNAEDTENKKKKVKEKRDSTISFRVSKSQRKKITSIANECGMILSDYVLSRAYGYEPKVRLTPEQEAVREQLVIARSDYAKYTSMLNAMSQDERRAMFRNQPWMIGALRLLGKTADMITRLIKKHFAPNRIPAVKNMTVQQETVAETDKEEAPT
ncbi:metalloproteinase [uncultured Bacteroides sp.]|uniref:plasmid mobilization protein n=1 Tax=uncultured Bacteroides sp. TaxID=162156 RepID=UPI00260320DD|nr:metalloproteinase [uncultured Bacteroides sp.]